MRQAPYVTIYARLVNTALAMMNEHPHWDEGKAVRKAAESNRMLKVYFATLKPHDVAELLDVVRRKQVGR